MPLFFRRLIRKLPADPTWIRNHLQRTLAAFGTGLSSAGEIGAPVAACTSWRPARIIVRGGPERMFCHVAQTPYADSRSLARCPVDHTWLLWR